MLRSKYRNRKIEDADSVDDYEASGTAATQVDEEAIECCIAEIECCLAEAAPVKSDEELAEEAFSELRERNARGEFANYDEYKAEGTVLKVRFAHTAFVQQERCCYCGCPWDE